MPPGARTLLLVIVLTTSVSVKPDALSCCGSTATWIDGVTVPFSCTYETPSICSSDGTILLMTSDERSPAPSARERSDQRDDDRFARIVDRDLRRLDVVGQRVLRVLHAALDLHQIVVLIRVSGRRATIEAWPGWIAVSR